ncbi:hypothetical protein PA25_24800 [Pseudoalteromonas sp. A25]|uniref:hypothetical protein n=1 Tax=Pseudoalteromonas sp. A25 TaxID=116092 RepID=UPI0012609022|nr:hypothetical protein [Pseudoalteromonas sp. A25]BBN82495.1 hypothetical protein PA25_24800 [Pseudoalteromonas sp. A25]
MNLVGSKTEKDIEAELVALTSSTFTNSKAYYLRQLLSELGINPQEVIVLRGFPDETSEVYLLLIENRLIGQVEIDSDDLENPTIETFTLPEYKQGLSKIQQIRLAVAKMLLSSKT